MALKFGDRGSSVEVLQKQLLAHGFSPQGIDGIFGSDTRSAVAAFQRANGIFPADGTASAKTLAALALPPPGAFDFMGPMPGGGPLATAPGPFASFFGDVDWRLGVALGGLALFGLLWWANSGGKR